jgi:hypothetical protein
VCGGGGGGRGPILKRAPLYQARASLSSARLSIKRAPLGWVRGEGGGGSVQGRCRVGAGSVQGRGRVGEGSGQGGGGGGGGGLLGLYLIVEVGLIELDNIR